MDFFTSDLHLNHINIIKYCNRPFESVEEMNEVLIENWNKKVSYNDTVYVNGDFILGNYKESIEIGNKLNGKIILISGDHDKNIKSVKTHNVCQIKDYYEYKAHEHKIILFHWCIRTWAKSHYNSFHAFGHSHGRLEPIGKSWDIGVDNNNFEPLSYDELIEIFNKRPDNPNLVKERKY